MRRSEHGPPLDEFDEFVATIEAKLRVALVATYGPADGRVALGDALSWAWEHWDAVREMNNPVGYLYRVGQTSNRRVRSRPIPVGVPPAPVATEDQVVRPDVAGAITRLPMQQRRVVMLVHAFGWSQRDVAELLGVTPSSVKQALDRGVRNLLAVLEQPNED